MFNDNNDTKNVKPKFERKDCNFKINFPPPGPDISRKHAAREPLVPRENSFVQEKPIQQSRNNIIESADSKISDQNCLVESSCR